VSKAQAKSEATYVRELLRQIFEAKDEADLDEIATELVASTITICAELGAPSFR
jgi:hypothetical protein